MAQPERAAAEAAKADGTSRDVVVVGAGPAGLMAADRLAAAGHRVTVIDRMPSPARKLLMAGRGGLNITHSEPLEAFLDRYTPACAPHLERAVRAFSPESLLAFVHGLGIETFVGSSGRVFPKSMKASPLLRAWLRRLDALGVRFVLRTTWHGWDDEGRLTLTAPDGARRTLPCAGAVLALGGASWPRLGSDGSWVAPLRAANVAVRDLVPSNAGVLVPWSVHLRGRFAGTPLKRIAVTVSSRTVKGEAVITRTGLEGGCIYALNPQIRAALATGPTARLTLDLKPDLDAMALERRLAAPRGKQSASNFLRKASGLPPAAIALLREAAGADGRLPPTPAGLARRIKALELDATGLSGLDRAISSAGGVGFEALDEHLMLRERPGVFVAGEMLDFDAPTGGYLLQAAFATGVAAAEGLLAWLGRDAPRPAPQS